MRATLATLALLLAPGLAWSAEPVVKLKGPSTAATGTPFYLDVAGTVSDKPLKVRAAGPDAAKIRVWYDESRNPGLVEMVVQKPGSYLIVVLATGKAEGETDSAVDFAPWAVTVSGTAPKPPPPGPDPPKPPDPPAPAPVSGKLYGMLVLPAAHTGQQAAIRTDPAVRAGFASNNAFFSSYLESESEVVNTPYWRESIAAAGGAPCILWFDSAGKLVGSSKDVSAAGIVGQLRALRGAK